MAKIALIGEAGSGKDFIAEMMIAYFDFKRYAFADPIKRIASEYFPELYGDGSAKNRELLISIGESFRGIYADVWVDYMVEAMDRNNYERVVVTDVRRQNEYDALRAAGFVFVRIKTTAETRNRRIAARGDVPQPEALKHETERLYDTFDCEFVLDNDFDEPILAYAAIDNLMDYGFNLS